MMAMRPILAREAKSDPINLLKKIFPPGLFDISGCDVAFRDASLECIIAITGLAFRAPVISFIFSDDEIACYLSSFDPHSSLLIQSGADKTRLFLGKESEISEVEVPSNIHFLIWNIRTKAMDWTGYLNSDGEHVVDLRTPSPGAHFNINLLLGNRIDSSHSLQMTPKSVVDRFGRGSFRSHAATQVLATRWDLRAEENGFPANRQFYLLENGKPIFYSGTAMDGGIISAVCKHSQNHTRITYRTGCGLEIRRLIFILPQKTGQPLAVESHRIEIANLKEGCRKFILVYTGMFGTAAPHALWEDVLYSNIIMQAKILRDVEHNLIAVGSDYYPDEFRKNLHFHSTLVHTPSGPRFPNQFSFDYTEFVGNGTLEKPQNVGQLSNRLSRKGPGFFAVGVDFKLDPGQTIKIDNFTGMVSSPLAENPREEQYSNEINALLNEHLDPGQTDLDLGELADFTHNYSDFIKIRSDDHLFDTYFNSNLPFQVLYQTYVSRSFGQTQKGYREIGFREIQDIYASMYYLISMGRSDTVKDLLRQWIENVYAFGYANHNFYWKGKEPGKWSDDALWLIQAIYRYIVITGDVRILDEEFAVAGSDSLKKRKLFDTICAIIIYSAKISVGPHGLPLIDSADWNDCLKIDADCLSGPQKEQLYFRQIEKNQGTFGDPFESGGYSESVMNAFLLKHGVDLWAELCRQLGDHTKYEFFSSLATDLNKRIQTHAWKEDFFARVLLNRNKEKNYRYIGAAGDGLSADDLIPGVYFLNSFSWSVLSECATEAQIAVMVDTIEKYLKSPFGLKLMTPAALDRVASGTATGHYFSGDRENGAVFKHAAMMAVAALFKAYKKIANRHLARRLSTMAYWMIDLALPFKTLSDPYKLGGNPRFCTQYINSETGENIGPLLSGTATWLMLALFSAFGIEFTGDGFYLDPVLRESQSFLDIKLNSGKAVYHILLQKPIGLFRIIDSQYSIELDGRKLRTNFIPLLADQKEHCVVLEFTELKEKMIAQ